MNTKKILHVVSVSFSIKYFIGNQFRYFKDKGYEFHVACSESEELFVLAEKYDFKPFPIPIVRAIDPVQDLQSIWALKKYISNENFDIVITHSPKGGLIGMLAAYLAKVPNRFFFRHGLVFETSNGFKKKLLIAIEKLIGRLAHKIVNVSESVENIAEKLKLNDSSKNVMLGKGTCNGVDLNEFKYRPGFKNESVITIGFVGRLTIDKGIVELIDGWKILKAKYSNSIRLMLVGPVDSRDPLNDDLINYIKSDKAIELIGSVPDTKIYYNMMDIFILPSYREGFPTVILEASASELPIITTRSTGCIDAIIENETGLFVEINGGSISSVIEQYLINKELRTEHGIQGRNFVKENFSEGIIYKEIEKKIFLS
ncbi:glycosyltransferase family 4 protein [Sphingobacterium spiritivorum]|uniref:glycosyltransferase family 4 protein n=1 Tax=Sphingobacterium spiritivorum TaxID=258 RepID=UPI003DA52F53